VRGDLNITALNQLFEDAAFDWHETLGVASEADLSTIRKAMRRP